MDTNTVLEVFLRHLCLERGLSERSVETYGGRLGEYLRNLAGQNVQPEAARRDDVVAHLAALRERGLSAASILCSAAAIRSFYQYLVDRNAVAVDPTTKLKLPKPSVRLPEPLTTQEVERLLATPSAKRFAGIRDRAILEILYCGLRMSEALGLDVDKIHLEAGYLKVNGKGDKNRLVPLSRTAVEALTHYLEIRATKGHSAVGPLFLSSLRRRLTLSGFWRRFQVYARRSKIGRAIHPHLLRHSFSVHMLAGHADLRSLQLLLGHSSLVTTQKYLNLDIAALRDVIRQAHPRA